MPRAMPLNMMSERAARSQANLSAIPMPYGVGCRVPTIAIPGCASHKCVLAPALLAAETAWVFVAIKNRNELAERTRFEFPLSNESFTTETQRHREIRFIRAFFPGCHPERRRAPARSFQHGKSESKDLGAAFRF